MLVHVSAVDGTVLFSQLTLVKSSTPPQKCFLYHSKIKFFTNLLTNSPCKESLSVSCKEFYFAMIEKTLLGGVHRYANFF